LLSRKNSKTHFSGNWDRAQAASCVPPRRPASHPAMTASVPAGRERERAMSVFRASASDPAVVGRCQGTRQDDDRTPAKPPTLQGSCLAQCHSSQWVINSDGFYSPYSASS